MQSQTSTSQALKVMLAGFIDYAGLYPPAKLELSQALANYQKYRTGKYTWMLRHFVLGTKELPLVPEGFQGSLSVLAQEELPQAAALESRAPILKASKPVYCEIGLDELHLLEDIKSAGNYAKIRMGGLAAEAFPSCKGAASFIQSCASLKLPFKATAGLHHALRASYKLCYEPDSAEAVMHGFINLIMAAAFAWAGESDLVEQVLQERDAAAFTFDQNAHYKNKTLSLEILQETRQQFLHSVGSCSFEEPIQDLEALGLF